METKKDIKLGLLYKAAYQKTSVVLVDNKKIKVYQDYQQTTL